MQKYTKVQSNILYCACEDAKRKLLKQTQVINNSQKEWRSYAAQLVKELKAKEKAIKNLESVKHDQIKQVAAHSGVRQMLTSVTDCTGNLHMDKNCLKARKLWNRLEKINANCYNSMRNLSNENAGEHTIDADHLNIQVPSVLLDNAEDELRKAKIEQIFENGKLNFVNFLKLSNISMCLLGKKLSQVPFQSLSKELNTLELSQRSRFSDISNLMDLKSTLEKLCSDHSENVSQLLSEGFSSTPSGSHVKRRTKYTLAPPTPPISFEAFEGPTPEDARFLRKSLGNMNRNGETPEMAEAILRKLETKAKPKHSKIKIEKEKDLKTSVINPKLKSLRTDMSKLNKAPVLKKRTELKPSGVSVPRNKCFTPQVNKFGKSACLVTSCAEDKKVEEGISETVQDSPSLKMDQMAVSLVEGMMNESKDDEFSMETRCKLSFNEETEKSSSLEDKQVCENVRLVDLEDDADKENYISNEESDNSEQIEDLMHDDERMYNSDDVIFNEEVNKSDDGDNNSCDEKDNSNENDDDDGDGADEDDDADDELLNESEDLDDDSAVGTNTPSLTPREGAKCPSPTSSISNKSIESNHLDVDSIIKRAKERLNHSPGPSSNIQGLIGRFEEIRKRAGLQTLSFRQETNSVEFKQSVSFIQEELVTMEKESEELLNSPEMKAKFSTTLF
ncbi:DgyrCDS8257 [Dimorphilus gyrociliatus]|nr:DgyrCDS8257 [Dimorphilus gyrociliatus]